jgi:hypothetical protein
MYVYICLLVKNVVHTFFANTKQTTYYNNLYHGKKDNYRNNRIQCYTVERTVGGKNPLRRPRNAQPPAVCHF